MSSGYIFKKYYFQLYMFCSSLHDVEKCGFQAVKNDAYNDTSLLDTKENCFLVILSKGFLLFSSLCSFNIQRVSLGSHTDGLAARLAIRYLCWKI